MNKRGEYIVLVCWCLNTHTMPYTSRNIFLMISTHHTHHFGWAALSGEEEEKTLIGTNLASLHFSDGANKREKIVSLNGGDEWMILEKKVLTKNWRMCACWCYAITRQSTKEIETSYAVSSYGVRWYWPTAKNIDSIFVNCALNDITIIQQLSKVNKFFLWLG